MKEKIIGIFVCMLLIATFAIPISAIDNENIQNTKSISKGVDVPVWEIGDSWTYNIEVYQATSPNITDDMVAIIGGEITFEVMDDTGDIYKLEGIMKPIKGKLDIPGNIDLRITRLSSYKVEIELEKTNLAILNHDWVTKGVGHLTVGPIPLPILLQMQAHRYTEFNPALDLLPFPLNDGDSGTIGSFTVSEQSKVSMFWGLITIEDAEVEWPLHECEYTCTFQSISVPAGTFDVYTVEAEYHWGYQGDDTFHSHYAEDVGNVVKTSLNIDFGETEVTYYSMVMELVSTTYEP